MAALAVDQIGARTAPEEAEMARRVLVVDDEWLILDFQPEPPWKISDWLGRHRLRRGRGIAAAAIG